MSRGPFLTTPSARVLVTGVFLALAGCSGAAEVAGPSRAEVLASYLRAGYSDGVVACFVGLGERAYGLDELGRISVESVADGAGPDPVVIALSEVLSSCLEAERLADPDRESAPAQLAMSDEPRDRGDDPELDALWDACEGGSGAACDELWATAPIDSVYEQFGVTCGNRFEVLDCTRQMDEPAEATAD